MMHAGNLMISGSAFVADFEPDQVEEFIECRHHIAVSLGNTCTEEVEDFFAVRLDYEYCPSPLISVGVLGECATGDLDASVVGASSTLHPAAGWRLVGMPGMEIADDEAAFPFRVGPVTSSRLIV
jgi:hypothetical protein